MGSEISLDDIIDNKEIVELINSLESIDSTIDLSKLEILDQFNQKMELIKDIRLNKKELFKGVKLSTNNYISSFDTSSIEPIQRTFNEFRISNEFQILEVPFSLSGNVLLSNGRFDTKVSAVAIEYNQKEFLQDLKDKEFPLPNIDDIFNENIKVDHLLNNIDYNYLKSELALQILEKAILETRRMITIDSTFQEEMNLNLEKIEKAYGSYLDIKNQFSDKSQKDLIFKLDQLANQYLKLENKNYLVSKLFDKDTLKLKDKIKSGTKNFGLGRISILNENLATKNLSINGVQYEFEGRKYYSSISTGVERFNTDFAPAINQFINNQIRGTKFFVSSFGYKLDDSKDEYLEGGLLFADSKPMDPDTAISNLRTKNIVYSVRAKKNIIEQLNLISDVALSTSYFDPSLNVFTDNSNRNENLVESSAFEFDLEYFSLNRSNSSISLGYFYNGPNYNSLGNPFIFLNKQGLAIKANIASKSNKFNLNVEFQYGEEIEDEFISENRNFNFNLNGSYIIGKTANLGFIVSPNIYKIRFDERNGVDVTSNIYSLTFSSSPEIFSVSSSTLVTLSNFNTNQIFTDTLQFDQNYNLIFNESIGLAERHDLQLFLQLTESNARFWDAEEYIFKLNHSMTFENLSLLYGFQSTVNQFLGNDKYYGANCMINWKLNEQMIFNIRLDYLKNFKKTINNTVFNGNMGFSYTL